MTSGGRANGSRFQNRSCREGVADLRQPRAAAAQVDARRAASRVAGELLHHELDARRPDLDVVADDPGDLVALVDRQAARVVDLERFGARERQVQAVGDATS